MIANRPFYVWSDRDPTVHLIQKAPTAQLAAEYYAMETGAVIAMVHVVPARKVESFQVTVRSSHDARRVSTDDLLGGGLPPRHVKAGAPACGSVASVTGVVE